MKKLSEVEKETLLIRVLSQGRGSVEYARDLLTGANDPESEPPEPENDIVECAEGCRMSRKLFATRKEPVLLPM